MQIVMTNEWSQQQLSLISSYQSSIFIPVHSSAYQLLGTAVSRGASGSILILMWHYLVKVRKTARIMNRYNQVSLLSHDTKLESNKITINNTNESQ